MFMWIVKIVHWWQRIIAVMTGIRSATAAIFEAWSYNYYHARVIRHLISADLMQTLACSLNLLWTDYCNEDLYSTPPNNTQKLDCVQDCSAGTKAKAVQLHTTTASAPLDASLTAYYLQVSCLRLKISWTATPDYHSMWLWMHSVLLRHSNGVLHHYTLHKISFSGRAFLCTAPTTWNSLPNIVTAASSVKTSKSWLKIHLFNQTFKPTCS